MIHAGRLARCPMLDPDGLRARRRVGATPGLALRRPVTCAMLADAGRL